MIFLQRILAAIVLTITFSGTAPAGATEKEEARLAAATGVIEQMMAVSDTAIPPEIMTHARGIAIFPGVIKAGFILGGRFGTGVMLVRAADGSWGNPFFLSIAGGSIGLQFGVEATDIILVFRSQRSTENMAAGKFTLGAAAGLAAGPIGRGLEAATDAQLRAEIVSYARSRGLFAGLSIEGATLQVDDEAFAALYGVAAGQTAETPVVPPPAAVKLKETLSRYGAARTGD